MQKEYSEDVSVAASASEACVGRKQVYKSPALTVFGTVRDLTGNGDGTGADLGANPAMTMVSDPRAKENVVRIGWHPRGFGLYLFDYKPEFRDQFGHGRQFGVMADEVGRLVPAAIKVADDGYRRVNYDLLGIRFGTN